MLKRISFLAVALVLALVAGLVSSQRESTTDGDATTRLPDIRDQLRAIGYLDWSAEEASPEESGVMVRLQSS